jgi:hypothetical protein
MYKIDSTTIYERNGNTLSIETFLDEEDLIVVIFSCGDTNNGLHVIFSSKEFDAPEDASYFFARQIHKEAVRQNSRLPNLDAFMNVLEALEEETGDNPKNIAGNVAVNLDGTVHNVEIYELTEEELSGDTDKYWQDSVGFGRN